MPNFRKICCLSMCVPSLLLMSNAQADLYISPVMKNTKFIYQESRPSISPNIPGQVSFGENVPLSLAINKSLDDHSQWRIHIQKGLSAKKVTWRGGTSTPTILRAIATQNNLFIKVNAKSRVIGVGSTPDLSTNLAKPSPTVWTVNNTETLSKNIKSWLNTINYTLDWQSNRDFSLKYSPTLTGNLLGPHGNLEKVLKSVSNQHHQLYAVVNHTMHVVTIKERQV